MPAVRYMFDAELPHLPDYSNWLPMCFPFAPPGGCSQEGRTAEVFTSKLPNRFEHSQKSNSQSGHGTLSRNGNSRVESLLRTPEPKPKGVFRYNSPDVKHLADKYTPPRGLQTSLMENDNDIEVALQQDSVDLLSLALCRSHHCACSHPLHAAVQRGNPGAVELLLKHDMSSIDDTCGGRRPLHLAVRARADACDQIVATLLQYKANPNCLEADDISLNCPLHDATWRGHSGLVKMLLHHGADSDFQGPDASTALHIACKQLTLHKEVMSIVFLDCIKCLLASGADPRKIDEKGHIPGDYLEDWKHKGIMLRAQYLWHRRTIALVSRTSFDWVLPETFKLIALFL